MSTANRFLRNVASNYVVTGADALILILLTPFVVHQLGIEHYAVWIIVQTIGYYLSFLDIGLPDAQVRQHAALLARRDMAGLSRLHGTVLLLYLGAGLLALLLAAAIAASPSAALFDIPESAQDLYGPALLLIGLATLFSFLELGCDGVFEGYQRYATMNLVNLAVKVGHALAVVALLAAGFGLLALVVARCTATATSAAAKMLLIRRRFPASAAPRLGFDRESWHSVRSYSLWNSLNDFMTEGTAHFDKLLIPVLLSAALVTPYSLTVMLAAAIFVLAEPITDTFLPISSARHAARDRSALTALLTRGSKLVVLATLPVTVAIMFFGNGILALWVGHEYTDISSAVLWFTAANFFFSTYLWTSLNVLMGAGEIRRIFFISVFEVALVLGLILALVPAMGLAGLALAGLMGNVLTGLFLFVPAACRLTTLTPRIFMASGLLPMLVAALPGCLAGAGLAAWLVPEGWFETLGAAAITGAVTLLGLLALSTTARERARYYVTFRRLAGAA